MPFIDPEKCFRFVGEGKFKKSRMLIQTRDSEERCVLVGLKIDGNGRDLLNWALGKVANHGDPVVAVHVCRNSDPCDNSIHSLVKVLEDYLGIYKGLCSLKQIVLEGRVSRGSSIRRVLVREAELCSATTVVVGVGKNYPFRASTSLAKYCAKKLPPSTAIIAVNNGKIVFERGAPKLSRGSITHPITSIRGDLEPPSIKPIIPNRQTMSEIGTPRRSDVSYGDSMMGESISNDHCHLVKEGIEEFDQSSISNLVQNLPDKPGWPLLQRAALTSHEEIKGSEARKMSVVQWVLNLPDRSSSSIQFQIDEDGKSGSTDLAKELERIFMANSSNCKWFHYEDLQSSTNQFSSENLIGNGGGGRVYKGSISGGEKIAIKSLKLTEEASRDFLLEVDIITKVQHERIVPLLGICVEDNRLFSVHRYFCKGSLEENLHDKSPKYRLSWDTRFKIAIGIAEALNYIHNGCSRPVIHRDVKSSNILLSDELEPHLSDFGLALWAPTNSSYFTHSDVLGSFGYFAPEYFMHGRVSDKIDLYAFGVVLLELLTGRKPINDENPKGQESLVMWSRRILERGDIMELIDPTLEKYDEDQMRRMILAASLCTSRVARLRPPISQILGLLQGDEENGSRMNSRNKSTLNDQDEEASSLSRIKSHISLALLDVDDDDSISSFETNRHSSLEDYLQGRWSRSSSFD